MIRTFTKAKEIKEDFPSLTDYEALDIATKIIYNELMVKANVISLSDSYPSALEKIALELEEIKKQML
ncbi:hypothetical protein ACJVDH_00255 [Pedobacter sp. AW1-32]|uniref:hypothetical protein n=1 Tax=Pedobacter sp. AW1-32 TaxID=3383026 RepID=UPI003FEFBC6F